MTVLRILLYSPDVILIGKDNDYSSIGVLTQPPDNLVKLSRSWFTWYFHWLGNAQTTWLGGKKTNKQNKNNVSKCFIRRTCLRCNLTQIMPLSSFNPYLFFNLLDFFYDKCTIKCALVQYFTEWGMQGIKKKVFLGQKEGILETGLTINSGYDSDSETRGQ